MREIENWISCRNHKNRYVYYHIHDGHCILSFLKGEEELPVCRFCCKAIPKEVKVLLDLSK